MQQNQKLHFALQELSANDAPLNRLRLLYKCAMLGSAWNLNGPHPIPASNLTCHHQKSLAMQFQYWIFYLWNRASAHIFNVGACGLRLFYQDARYPRKCNLYNRKMKSLNFMLSTLLSSTLSTYKLLHQKRSPCSGMRACAKHAVYKGVVLGDRIAGFQHLKI